MTEFFFGQFWEILYEHRKGSKTQLQNLTQSLRFDSKTAGIQCQTPLAGSNIVIARRFTTPTCLSAIAPGITGFFRKFRPDYNKST